MNAPEPPLLHSSSRLLLTPLIDNLPHALLLYGQEGVGLLTIARYLSKDSLAAVLEPTNSSGGIDHSGTISVEAIRQLYEQTRTKHAVRVIVIDDADRMSHGAQSAFLKLLEEPNEGTRFILTSHQPDRLLPTIHSRVQASRLLPISAEQTLHFITSLGVTDQVRRIQLRYIADGLPAELYRLANDDTAFSRKAAVVGDARDFLQGDGYKKALIAQKYKGDRNAAVQLIDSALIILRKTISAKPEERIVYQLNQLLSIRERLQANCNVALQLMRFVL